MYKLEVNKPQISLISWPLAHHRVNHYQTANNDLNLLEISYPLHLQCFRRQIKLCYLGKTNLLILFDLATISFNLLHKGLGGGEGVSGLFWFFTIQIFDIFKG